MTRVQICRKTGILLWPLLAASISCAHRIPGPKPIPPVIVGPSAYCIAPMVRDSLTGAPIQGADVYIDVLHGITNENGYVYLQPVPMPNVLDVYATGYVDYSEKVNIQSWACDHVVRMQPKHGPRPTRAQTMDIKANFLSMHDSLNRLMFSWFYPTLTPTDQQLWRQAYATAQLTHVVLDFAPAYPAYWAPAADYRSTPATLVTAASDLLDQGLIPIIMMTTGDAGTWTEIDSNWPAYIASMRQLEPCLIGENGDPCGILVPGFEIGGPCSTWSAASISHAFTVLHNIAPAAIIGYEACPERFSGASNPVQPDDPWHGTEAGFFTSHGGEFVSVFLYETPHGPTLLDPAGASGAFCHSDSPCGAWEDRWTEGLQRLCTGGRGWRFVPCAFFEVTGSDYKSGSVSDDTVLRINNRALRLCNQYGAKCGFGNGLPDQPR